MHFMSDQFFPRYEVSGLPAQLKSITDLQVVTACNKSHVEHKHSSIAILMAETGMPWKVVYRAMERAKRRKLIDCGVSIGTAWVTDKGRLMLLQSLYQQGTLP